MMQRKRYIVPVEVDQEQRLLSAARRRAALVAGGCSTYATGLKGGEPSIICLCCGLGSAHPEDISHRYCGFCHEFHSEERG